MQPSLLVHPLRAMDPLIWKNYLGEWCDQEWKCPIPSWYDWVWCGFLYWIWLHVVQQIALWTWPHQPDHIYWIIWITIWDRKPDLACWTGIWIQNHNMVEIFVVRIWVGMHWFGSLSVISSDIRLASKEVIMMHPGSQLAVTLQAVSGLVNCDVTCTAGLPTGTN